MKLNLLLDLVGQLFIANQPRPAAMPVRFNALGAVWQHQGVAPAAGADGVLELYLRDCIVEPLRLSGRIATAAADGKLKMKFDDPGEVVADLIEKLAFRRHRRQVAGARR
jgi:Atypical PilZ domain, cyclic di-GMP receptor